MVRGAKMKLKNYILLGMLSMCQLACAKSDDQVFVTNKDGRSVEVILQKVTETDVTVKLVRNLKKHTLKLADLDNASQQKIKKWLDAGGGLSKDFGISFLPGKSVSKSKDASMFAGLDDNRYLSLKPKLTIKNGDRTLATKPLTVSVIVFGRSHGANSKVRVLLKDVHELPVLKGGAEHEIVCKHYNNSFMSSDRYMGYLVVIHDGEEVVPTRCSPEKLVEDYGSLEELIAPVSRSE